MPFSSLPNVGTLLFIEVSTSTTTATLFGKFLKSFSQSHVVEIVESGVELLLDHPGKVIEVLHLLLLLHVSVLVPLKAVVRAVKEAAAGGWSVPWQCEH